MPVNIVDNIKNKSHIKRDNRCFSNRISTAILKILLVSIATILLISFVGCEENSSVKIGWVETSYPGHLEASYNHFDGSAHREFSVSSGDALNIDYQAEVKSGTLKIVVGSPAESEPIWSVKLDESSSDIKVIRFQKDGEYIIEAIGYKTEGNFKIEWEIE